MKNLPAKLLAVALCLPLAGCETLSSMQANPRVVFAETEALKLAQSFFNNGGEVDNAWGISQGINLIGDMASFAMAQRQAKDTAAANAAAAAKLAQQVKDFASDPKAVNALASGLAGVMTKSNPQNPTERAKVTLAIAGAVEKATAFNAP